MNLFSIFRKKQKPQVKAEAEPAKNRYSENLKRAVNKARNESQTITAYDHTIRPPDILTGVVPENVTPPVLAMDSEPAYQLAGQLYPTGGFVGFPYLAQLATRAEYRAFSSAISTEITRKWITFNSTQTDSDDHSEKIKQIEVEFRRLKIRSLIQKVSENDTLFGCGHIAIKLKGHDDTMPLILDSRTIVQGSLESFTSVEPIWSTPSAYNAIDPTAKDFYRPTSWYVLGKQIHANRFLTVVTRPLPDILKPAFNFAGMSLSQLAEPYVNNWLRTRQSVSDLINNFSLTILKTSLDQVLSGGDGSDIDSRAQLFILNKSNKGLMIVDNEREAIEQINTPLSGLHELQAQSQEQMCAVSKIPSVILTGISPNGMNASSEGELQAFNDWIAAQQEAYYRDPLEIILKIVQLNLFGEIYPEISFRFNPLKEMTAEQLANIRNINAQVAVNYINTGVLDPAEERERLASDPDSGYQGIDVDVMPEQPEGEPIEQQPELDDNQDIEAALDGWITLNGGSGDDEDGGSHVFVGKGGQIEKGAGALVGKKLSDLAGTKKFTKHETVAERADKQQAHPVQTKEQTATEKYQTALARQKEIGNLIFKVESEEEMDALKKESQELSKKLDALKSDADKEMFASKQQSTPQKTSEQIKQSVETTSQPGVGKVLSKDGKPLKFVRTSEAQQAAIEKGFDLKDVDILKANRGTMYFVRPKVETNTVKNEQVAATKAKKQAEKEAAKEAQAKQAEKEKTEREAKWQEAQARAEKVSAENKAINEKYKTETAKKKSTSYFPENDTGQDFPEWIKESDLQ